MAEIKLIKKEVKLGANIEYTYQCFCDPRPLKNIVVTSGNPDEAKNLAQLECDEYCRNGVVGKKEL